MLVDKKRKFHQQYHHLSVFCFCCNRRLLTFWMAYQIKTALFCERPFLLTKFLARTSRGYPFHTWLKYVHLHKAKERGSVVLCARICLFVCAAAYGRLNMCTYKQTTFLQRSQSVVAAAFYQSAVDSWDDDSRRRQSHFAPLFGWKRQSAVCVG